MIDTNQIDNLKQAISKEFDKKETDDILKDTMSLVIKDNHNKHIIKDEHSYILGCGLQKMIHALDKKIVEHHAPMKKAADAVKKAILDAENKARENLVVAKGILAEAIGLYLKTKEEKAKEKARLEQEKIEQERMRQAQAKEDEAKKLKEEGNIQAALDLEEEVEEILNQETPIIQVEQPQKVAGMRITETLKFEIEKVEDIPHEIFIKSLFEMVTEKQKKEIINILINAYVRTMKDKAKISGVRIFAETKASVTGK